MYKLTVVYRKTGKTETHEFTSKAEAEAMLNFAKLNPIYKSARLSEESK